MNAREVLTLSPIIPVITIEDEKDALPLAKALSDGGVNVMEITLRTPAGIKAIEIIAKELPNIAVGAGTVINATQYDEVCKAGAKFVISPGFTIEMLEYSTMCNVPLIPGVATPSEIMTALNYGLNTFKLFPANIVGGVGALKAFGAPFKEVKFCPTGGVNLDNLNEYLSLSNVLCVGGTWLTPVEEIKKGNFEKITQLCKEALQKIELN